MKKTLVAVFTFRHNVKNLKNIGAICLFSLFLIKPAFANSELYVFNPDHTSITWHVNHLGFSTPSGKFNKVDGSVMLDRNNPNRSHVEVTINTSSIVTGLSNLDNYLKGENFLNTKQFPTATFVSKKINLKGSNRATIYGDLTLLGVTKPIALEARLNKIGTNPFSKKRTAGFSAAGYIKRSDFGMVFGIPGISDRVKINIEAEATFSKKIESQSQDAQNRKNHGSLSNRWSVVTDDSYVNFKGTQSGSNIPQNSTLALTDQEQVTFRPPNSGSAITGKFNKLSGTIIFDPNHLDKSSINVSVDTKNVEIAFADAEIVRSKDWLASQLFPKATFQSTTITNIDFNNKDFLASGTLTIRGVSIPTTISFKLENYLPSATEVTAYGKFEIQRSRFGIGNNPKTSKGINDNVILNFKIKAKR